MIQRAPVFVALAAWLSVAAQYSTGPMAATFNTLALVEFCDFRRAVDPLPNSDSSSHREVQDELRPGHHPFVKIIVDSAEYRSWHELGHAAVCLHLGGDVELIEFLDDDPRGHARTRCVVTPQIEESVACAGFAAEFVLLDHDYAELGPGDTRNISQVVFHNASGDREDFWARKLAEEECFTTLEDEAFMNHAIKVAAPIVELYFSSLQQLAHELTQARRVDGWRIKEVLRGGSRCESAGLR